MASKRKGPSKQLRQTTLFKSPKAFSHASSSKTSSPTGLKRKQKPRILQTHADSDSDDDDKDISSIRFVPIASENCSDDDSVIAHAPKRRKTVIVDSDDSEHVVRQRKPRKKKTISRDSDDDNATEQPKRRKLKKKRDVALVSSTDDEELAEEVDKERIIESRLRNRNKKSAFQKNLEKLKRRKRGKPSESSSSPNEESASSEDDDVPFKGAKPSSDFDSLFDEDSEATSSDFIVEDDNSVVATLPVEFSMESHEDLDHQFKKIFQFFVHIAVRPAKERHHFMEEQLHREQYFSMPLQTVRRKLSALKDSLVSSSVWRPDFKKALARYPVFDLVPLDFAVPSCDACHLGGRMSTLIGRLSGSPYDPLGFEFKDKDYSGHSDSTNSDEDDMSSKNEKVEVHLGRFCARRTRVYHQFTHWEYALFKCIRDEVDELHENRQSRGFFRIAYVGGVKPPKDLDDADGICDWLDQRKVIDMEWKKIKDMMENARHLELDKGKGDDD